MIFYLHLSIFSLTLYLLPVGQKLVMIICLLKLNGASVFIFLWCRKYSYWQKVRGEIDILINSEYNESDWLSNKREMLKKNMLNFIQKMHMREIERILGKRERILGEREREYGERQECCSLIKKTKSSVCTTYS